MKKIQIQSVSSLRDQRTGLDPDPSGADSSNVSGRTSQLEFDAATDGGNLKLSRLILVKVINSL